MSKLQFLAKFSKNVDVLRPREKLAQFGVEALDFWELVALILRVGVRTRNQQENVEQLAKRLLADAGFRGLFTQKSVPEMQENFGVFKSHAQAIVGVSEIVRRLNDRFDIFDASEPSKIFKIFKDLQKSKKEQCFVLCLNETKQCIVRELVAMGQINVVRITPNDILKTPIWLGFKQIVLIHNHVGTAKASKSDIIFTKKLEQGAFDLHEIQLFDHIIVGQDGYFSFHEKGLL